MRVYAFDVDHTLEVSNGPVPVGTLVELVVAGHIVGLCGNWAMVTTRVRGWQRVVSFLGPLSLSKADFLRQLATYVPADEYVMVGNDPAHYGASEDRAAASEAGWRFIREDEFAAGER